MKPALIAAVPALAAAMVLALPAESDARTFRMGHVFETNHPYHQAALEAVEQFQACTDGDYAIDIYPASQLGSDSEMQEQIRIGGVDVTLTGFIFAANDYPPLAISAAPFLFEDRDHALRYMESDLFKEAWDGWSEATGQHVLSSAFFGFFNVTSKEPIETPDDIRGVRIRVPDVPIYLAFPEAVGANPTPIPLHEVYLALQQGVADASANGLSMTYAHNFYEVQDYVNTTRHMVDYTLWVTSDDMMSALDENGRACLQEAADLWGEKGSQLLYELENELQESLVADGHIEFIEPDRDLFRAEAEGSIEEFAEMLGVDIAVVEAIRDLK